MCCREHVVGAHTQRPPIRRLIATADGFMPPTSLLSATPPYTGVGASASHGPIASRSITVLWWCDFTRIARMPMRAPS